MIIMHKYDITLNIIYLDIYIFAGIDDHIEYKPGNNIDPA